MAATKNTASTEAVKQITYLASALKAPRITEAAARLADQAVTRGGPMRTTSPRSSNAKCPPATPPAPTYGSAPRDSVPSRRWRTSTSTPNQPSGNKSGPLLQVGS